MSGELAPAHWGIPVVSGSSERAALFPSPKDDQRVFNKTTGNIERWSGFAWLVDFFGAAAPVFNIAHARFGAKVDGKEVLDGAITSGGASFSSASAGFTAADVGKVLTVEGAGAAGAVLRTTIQAFVSGTVVTLAANASTTVTGARTNFGTDDTAAVLLALAAMKAAGGGTLWVPDGISLCNTVTSASSLSWILGVEFDNFALDGPGDLRTTAAASLLFISGSGKPAGMANWATYDIPAGLTTYVISSAAKADLQVVCTTPADAGNFTRGDVIYIRTGQTLTIAGANQPDSELNEVLSANASTGVIALKSPLAKAYAAQNYPVGHPNAGTPAPFGISKVTDRVLKNISLRNAKLSNRSSDPVIIGGSIIGLEYLNLKGDCLSAFQSQGNYRHGHIAGCRVKTSIASLVYLFTTATGTSDVDIHDNEGTNELGALQFHIHEGSARVKVHDNLLHCKTSNVSDTPISVRAVAHDIEIHDNTIVVQGALSTVIYVDAGSGGLYESTGSVKNNRIIAPGVSAYSIRIADASGWEESGNRGDLGQGVWVEEGTNNFGPVDRIFFGAQHLTGFFGSAPALAMIQNRFQSYTFPDAATSQVGALFRIPKDWKQFKIYIWWTNPTAAVGNVFWQSGITAAGDGTDLAALGNIAKASGPVAAPGQNVLKRTEQTSGVNTWVTSAQVDPAKLVAVWAARVGADVNDTLAANASLIGIELVRAM